MSFKAFLFTSQFAQEIVIQKRRSSSMNVRQTVKIISGDVDSRCSAQCCQGCQWARAAQDPGSEHPTVPARHHAEPVSNRNPPVKPPLSKFGCSKNGRFDGDELTMLTMFCVKSPSWQHSFPLPLRWLFMPSLRGTARLLIPTITLVAQSW